MKPRIIHSIPDYLSRYYSAQRIIDLEEDKPHEFLGPHRENGSVIIRTYLPEAARAWVSTGKVTLPMKRVGNTALFEVNTGVKDQFPYKLGFSVDENTLRKLIEQKRRQIIEEREWEITQTVRRQLLREKGWNYTDEELDELVNKKLWEIVEKELVSLIDRNHIQQIEDPYAFLPKITSEDIWYWREGTHIEAYKTLGAQLTTINDVQGAHFAVWAPNARTVSVVGDFNNWKAAHHPMSRIDSSGIWGLFIPGLKEGDLYKFAIKTKSGEVLFKADPFAFQCENPPKTASVIADINSYKWGDEAWLEKRKSTNHFEAPVSILEVHLGSWKRIPDGSQHGRFLSYREAAHDLVEYAKENNYTHIELLPIMEHPYYPSWGYQCTGYYAPTSRYGSPKDLMYLIDHCHQNNIGVILDWVPGHFATNNDALNMFDGAQIFAYPDPRIGYHKEWGTLVPDYGRPEVGNFFTANACYWFDVYHVDGLRLDGVTSMLYRDYNRKEGEWTPNIYGGKEHLEAVKFLRRFNETVHSRFPGILTIAEESTDYANVTRPTYHGGLGFTHKWNMGWMHDVLRFFSRDPIYRKHHLHELTNLTNFCFSENYILPISHDEVVHLKKSLLEKMPGDEWQKFANLRLFLAFMLTFPGKKLQFMGNGFAQRTEWNQDQSLDWHLLDYEFPEFQPHKRIRRLASDLNQLYSNKKALHELDTHEGFAWNNSTNNRILSELGNEFCILSYIRYSRERSKPTIVVCNMTPIPRNFYVSVPTHGRYREIFNTDDLKYGGSGVGNKGSTNSYSLNWFNDLKLIQVTLPPLAATMYEPL